MYTVDMVVLSKEVGVAGKREVCRYQRFWAVSSQRYWDGC